MLDKMIMPIMYVIVMLFLIGLIYFVHKVRMEPAEYDERQKLIQGKAYKNGFIALIVANVISLSSETAIPVASSQKMVFCILIGTGVFAMYCIWNDAYFAIKQNKRKTIIWMIVIGSINIVSGIVSLRSTGLMEKGVLADGFTQIGTGTLFLGMCIVLVIKIVEERNEE